MATVALLLWPLIAVGIFAALGPARGLIWACMVGYLFLPEYEAFDLPALPAYSKYSVISFGLLLGILVSASRGGSKPEITDKTVRLVMVVLISAVFLGVLGTVIDNTSPLVRFGRYQQGHSMRDLVSLGSEFLIAMVPFLLARRWLSDPKLHLELLFAFVVLACVYSFLVLFEARMSPQLNRWVYDFFPHSWRQHIRGGGFRPIVFLNHGLAVGFFLFMATMAAFTMSRQVEGKARTLYIGAGIWIFIVLIISRNMGATMLAALLIPAMLFLKRRGIVGIALVCTALFMFYPVARTALPSDQFVSAIASFSAARAQSLEFRLKHEGEVLEHAMEKPIFGWGGWGRGRVVDEKGRDVSVTDGSWIIQLSNYGTVGFIAYFGLLAGPIYFLRRRKEAPYTALGMGLIMSANLIYCIPNAEITPLTWLMAGTLAGYVQFGPKGAPAAGKTPEEEVVDPRRVAYSRFAPKNSGTREPIYNRNLSS